MKKLICIFLTGILSLSLFGCGIGNKEVSLDVEEAGAEATEGRVSVKAYSLSGNELTLLITNRSNDNFYYTESFYLQNKDGNEYVDMKLKSQKPVWEATENCVQPGEEVVFVCDLSLYGKVKPGDYRIRIENGVETNFTLK